MEIVDKINAEHRETPEQGLIQSQGNAYLMKQFPRLDFIKKASIEKAPGSDGTSQDRHLRSSRRRQQRSRVAQYVARPPLISKTAPVENEQSSEASQQIRAATSSSSRKRPIGMRASM